MDAEDPEQFRPVVTHCYHQIQDYIILNRDSCQISLQTVPHEFQTLLKRGEKLLGTRVSLGCPATAEILAGIGFDWLFVDGGIWGSRFSHEIKTPGGIRRKKFPGKLTLSEI